MATVWRYCDDFAKSQSVAEFDLTRPPSRLSLISYGAAFSPSNMVLGIAKTERHTWFVEYRGAHGWDRGIGLGPKWNPGANGNYDRLRLGSSSIDSTLPATSCSSP